MKIGLLALTEKLKKEGVAFSSYIKGRPFNVILEVKGLELKVSPKALISGDSYNCKAGEVVAELREKLESRQKYIEEQQNILERELAETKRLQELLGCGFTEEEVNAVLKVFVEKRSLDASHEVYRVCGMDKDRLDPILWALRDAHILEYDGEYPYGWDWVLIADAMRIRDLKLEEM